jgi:predicted nucleotide-binding protein
MLDRFQGVNGKRNLILALRLQYLIRDNEDVAKLIAEKVSIHEYPPRSIIITQDSSDDSLHLILSGSVTIQVNGRDIASRGNSTHVGEMAMIDPGARRSATVIAIEPTITACINSNDFFSIADKYPYMWRFLAMELGNRLRQRSQYISQPNNIPVLFLGSSRESLPIVKAIVSGLDTSRVIPTLWTEDVFRPSDIAIEDLEAQLPHTDFALLIFGPDDKIISRDIPFEGPRDNVLFEFGMFLGAIGRKRTYLLKPKGMLVKIPTDLMGLEPIEYEYDVTSRTFDVSNVSRTPLWYQQ